ncbi:hypothetical protein AB0B79_05765 [Streptomyces sp. NPDC039022]|uniref:hypothetical protein n=1 Tax=unclassified Streptomyces TaxID=2593676 RepID=UPI0033F6F04E
MSSQPVDDLYVRYMTAYRAFLEHTQGCPACQAGKRCPTGSPLHEHFARLQDAYRARQAKQQR